MSYDIFLYRKDGVHEPLKKTEIEKKLHPEFSVFEFNLDESELATYFWPYYSHKAQWSGFDYTYQNEEGCYWASCSFNVDKDELEYFKKEIREVAILLGFKIKDPQVSEELFDPADYDPNDARGIRVLEIVKEDMKPENMSKILGEKVTSAYPDKEHSEEEKEIERRKRILYTPAEDKYFFFFTFISKKPKTLENLMLVPEDNLFYGSKVEKGECLKDILEKDIKGFIGDEKYKLLGIEEGYDFTRDREGRMLPRTKLTFRVNYFDTKTVKTKHPMKWEPLS